MNIDFLFVLESNNNIENCIFSIEKYNFFFSESKNEKTIIITSKNIENSQELNSFFQFFILNKKENIFFTEKNIFSSKRKILKIDYVLLPGYFQDQITIYYE